MSDVDLKALRASVKRVKAYLDLRDAARKLDIDHIHAFDMGPDCGIEILASDLRALLKLADLAPAQQPAAAPVSGDVALPELPTPDHALDMGMQPFYRPDQMHAYARTYGQQCSDAGFNAGLDAAYSTYAPTEDEAWSIYNVQGGWGHEPTAKGLFIDGYRAASPKSAIVALRDLVDELLAGDDEGLIQHSDAMQSAIRALKGGE